MTQAETYAIIETCDFLTAKGTHNKNINICLDSQASLKALNGHCFTSKLAIECLGSLNHLSTSNRVNLFWVPGHSNVDGNEKADCLARKGSETPFCGPIPALGLTYSTQRSIIRNFYFTQHRKLWKSITTCNHSKTMYDGPSEKNTKFLLNKSRQDLRLITGAITGHCTLNKHMQRMGLARSAVCRRCDEDDETPVHLITSCPALTSQRMKFFEHHTINAEQLHSIKIENILNFFKAIQQ